MISVVIPAYRNPSDVRVLVESLEARCRSAPPFEIIVVDDGSGDPEFDRVAANHPRVRLLRLPSNAGASTARNVGARAAAFDVLLFLDSDMEVQTDVASIVSEMFQRPDVAAVVGAVDPEPRNPTPFTRFWGLLKAYSLPRGEYSSTFYPMIGAIRRDVFEAIGGFDERIRGASVEDYEISMRLRAAGVRVLYNPALLVRTGYHPMWKSLRQSFSRSGKWLLLVFAEDRHFDNHTTTSYQAAGVVTGTCLFASFCLALVSWQFLPAFAVLFALYGWVNRRFLAYVARHASPAFLITAIPLHVLLSLVICAGVAGALPFLLVERQRRLLRVYRA